MTGVLAPLPVLLPLMGAAAALLVGHHPRLQRTVSVLVLAGVVAVSVALLFIADANGATAVAVGDKVVVVGEEEAVARLKRELERGNLYAFTKRS